MKVHHVPSDFRVRTRRRFLVRAYYHHHYRTWVGGDQQRLKVLEVSFNAWRKGRRETLKGLSFML